MYKKIRSQIAKMLLVSMLFTQNGMIPGICAMADFSIRESQYKGRATGSNIDKNHDAASDSDLDEETSERDPEQIFDDALEIAVSDAATMSEAYALNDNLEPWDGISEKEIVPIGNIYFVEFPAELAWISKVTNDGSESFEGKTVSILNDLDMGGHGWPGIGTLTHPFEGSFEGNNCFISNIKKEDIGCIGFFGSIVANEDIYIQNLNLEAEVLSNAADTAALLAGRISLNKGAKITISNLNVSGTINAEKCRYGGGLVGRFIGDANTELEIKKVKVEGDINISLYGEIFNSNHSGGLIGHNYSNGTIKISDSCFDGNLTAAAYNETRAGGIIGNVSTDTIELNRVYVEGSISGNGNANSYTIVGGLIGEVTCSVLKINNSYETAKIFSGSIAGSVPGGLIGKLTCHQDYSDSSITNCHVSGELAGKNLAVFIAWNGSETETVLVDNCYYNKSRPGLDTDNKITYLATWKTVVLDCPGSYALTEENAGEESSYSGWDFLNVWSLEDGDYPKLREDAGLNKGLLAGMDSETLIYYLPDEKYETDFLDLKYEYCIDEEILEEDAGADRILSEIKIIVPQGFSFSPDEPVTECYINGDNAPAGYVYVDRGEQNRGSIKVYINEDLEKAEAFRFRISISATGFETYSSYCDMTVVMKQERPNYVPEDAAYYTGNGHYYKVFNQSMSWEEAKEYCERLKGHLVTITSQQEQNFVTALVEGSEKQNMWIGAEMDSEQWYWVIKEGWDYTNWGDGEPDQVDEEQIAVMIYTYSGMSDIGKEVKAGSWNDELKSGGAQTGQTISDIGFVCEWDVKEQEDADEDNIINIVKKYATGQLCRALTDIVKEGGSAESLGQKIEKLFVRNGISDPLYGIRYLKDTYDERWAYNALISNDMYIAYQHKQYLNSSEGAGARLFLIAAGLIFNNEIDEWVSLDTLTGETPGVSRYKEMLEGFIQLSSSHVESLNYSKKLLSFINSCKGYMEKKDIAELEDILKRSPVDNEALVERLTSLVSKVKKFDYDSEKKTFSCSLKDTQLSKALNISKDVFTLGGIAVDEFCGYMDLSAKLSTYRQYEDFLKEIVAAKKELPLEMRIAAHLIVQDLEQGYFQPMIKAVKEIGDWSVGKLDFMKLNIKDMAYWKMEAYAVNTWADIGNLTEKSKYTEGYGFLGEYFASKLQKDEKRFSDNPTESNAYAFFNDYILLYELRLEGEKAYRDMCDMNGAFFDLYKFIYQEEMYQTHIDAAEEVIAFLQEKCQMNVSEEFLKSNDEVKYSKKIVIDCPVDVIVYDSEGNQICYLSDGEEVDLSNEYGRFVVWYDPYSQEYGKSICLFEEDSLRVEIAGTGIGMMSVQVANKEGDIYKICNHPVKTGEKYLLYLEEIPVCISEDKDGNKTQDIPMIYDDMEYIAVSDVVIAQEALTCRKGEEVVPLIKILPENASNQKLTWFSSDENIAMVFNGKITALNEGQAEITVKSQDGHISKSFRLSVEGEKEKEEDNGNIPDEPVKKPEENIPDKPEQPEKPGESEPPEEPEQPGEPGESEPPEEPEQSERPEKGSSHKGRGSSSGEGKNQPGEFLGTFYIYSGTWEKSDEKWRFMMENGRYAKASWIFLEGKWYAIGRAGFMLTGWQLIDGNWYYFNPDGSMAVGWIVDNNRKYYLNPMSDGTKGKMLTGWQLIDGKWYYFNEVSDGTKGALLTDTWVGAYYVNHEGAWEEEKKRAQ